MTKKQNKYSKTVGKRTNVWYNIGIDIRRSKYYNMRSKAGISGEVVGKIKDGETVFYTGQKTKEEKDGHYWAEVIYNGKKGWVAADYLRTQPKQKNSPAPAIFSVAPDKYGPGIRDGGLSDDESGHTGVVLNVEKISDKRYRITYFHTYNSLKEKKYNSAITTKEFDVSDDVTYVNIKKYMK